MADVKVAQQFRLALEMYEFGERMYRASLRRRHPDASEAEIARMLRAWRQSRPGAPSGDADGARVPPVRVNVLEAALRRVTGDLSRYRQDYRSRPIYGWIVSQ